MLLLTPILPFVIVFMWALVKDKVCSKKPAHILQMNEEINVEFNNLNAGKNFILHF